MILQTASIIQITQSANADKNRQNIFSSKKVLSSFHNKMEDMFHNRFAALVAVSAIENEIIDKNTAYISTRSLATILETFVHLTALIITVHI